MTDRYFAADMLASLATRRYDDVAAADYAERSAKAGEAYMLFQPTELRAWGYWVNGLEVVANGQRDRGEIANAIATRRQLVALARDKRRPSSLAPLLVFPWLRLAAVERDAGQVASSERSLSAGLAAMKESLALYAPDDVRRTLFADPEPMWRSRVHLLDGKAQAALDAAVVVIKRIEPVPVAEGDGPGRRTRENILRGQYATAAEASLRLGRGAAAEAFARKWLAVPFDTTSDADPLNDASAARSMIAHALVLQGRGADALTELAPALAHYRKQQQANAHGSFFRHDFAYALIVSALAHGSADRAARDADLAEAGKLLEGMTAEAQSLATTRELSALIASARAS